MLKLLNNNKELFLKLPGPVINFTVKVLTLLGVNSRECKVGFLDGYGQYKNYHFYGGISNQFMWDKNFECTYIVENNLAIYEAQPETVKHILSFFDNHGNPIIEKEIITDTYHLKVNVSEILSDYESEYGSFTHHIYINPKNKSHNFWTRGYTTYFDQKFGSSSIIHGNVGHIERKFKHKYISHSAFSSKHFFKIPLVLSPENTYNFYYINTFCKDFSFNVRHLNDKNPILNTVYHLKPLATIKISYKPEVDELIEFSSNFSGFRPIVHIKSAHTNDIFHA